MWFKKNPFHPATFCFPKMIPSGRPVFGCRYVYTYMQHRWRWLISDFQLSNFNFQPLKLCGYVDYVVQIKNYAVLLNSLFSKPTAKDRKKSAQGYLVASNLAE
jgi:hypothetical protein